MTEDKMVGWHHHLDGHEFEQVPGAGDGQGSLVCCSPWDCKESDTIERLNLTELNLSLCVSVSHFGNFHNIFNLKKSLLYLLW